MAKIQLTIVPAMALALSGCDQAASPPNVPHRDQYSSQEHCLRDWKDQRNCKAGSSGYVHGPVYWGGNRMAVTGGHFVRPSTQRAVSSVQWNASAKAPVPNTTRSPISPVARGGFGGRGVAVGG